MDRYEDGYAVITMTMVEGIPIIEVNVWNMDHLANKKIKISINALTGRNVMILTDKEVRSSIRKGFFGNKKFYSTDCRIQDNKYLNYITPIKPKKDTSNGKPPIVFSTMYVETIEFKGKEMPISISIKTKLTSKIFIIDPVKLIDNLNLSILELWNGFFDFILNNCNKEVIFVHNLGSFDGFFIYKALSIRFKPEEISCLTIVMVMIDTHNKFIQITLNINKFKIIFKDSYRIFPVSLNDLCNILNLPGKTSKYNPKFHELSLFDNVDLLEEFKSYSIQDSNALFDCIFKLQEMYLLDYNVDICSILSTSTLSLKIFRSKFLKVNITILKRRDDTFIRQSYFGGATDYYKLRAFNLFYYDVNSLYPFAMMKPMPNELIRKITFKEGDDFNLDNFFGFIKVKVTCPKNIKVPLVNIMVKPFSQLVLELALILVKN